MAKTLASALGEESAVPERGMTTDSRRVAAELDGLYELLLRMARLAEARVQHVMRAFVSRNPEQLAEVIAGDAFIDALHIEIDDLCFRSIALHHPVAVDLRRIVSVLKINADLERVGDLAVNIGEAGQRYLRHPPVKPLIDLPRMGDLALAMLRESIEALVNTDVALAKRVLMKDEWVDALKDQIFREVLTYMLGDPRTVEPGVELILISRHLERVGDHATNVAEDVIFIVEARDVRHRSSNIAVVERRRQSGIAPV
jgi:phosphate transport system protein